MERRNIRIAIMEAFGVFNLCFFGGLSIISYTEAAKKIDFTNQISVALIHGLIIYLGTMMSYHISGGHLNPAISVGLYLTYRIEKNEMILYLASQGIGSLLAGVILAIFRTSMNGGLASDYEKWQGMGLGEPNLSFFTSETGELTTVLIPFFFEFIGTFILSIAYFSLAIDQKYSGDVIGKGIAIVKIVMFLSIGT